MLRFDKDGAAVRGTFGVQPELPPGPNEAEWNTDQLGAGCGDQSLETVIAGFWEGSQNVSQLVEQRLGPLRL
ncbi:hypothetical protein [Methylobacterium indicum]|uniref:hypothetical protein n=1 Tax=Methylobacterium indicum TaxID=1775910 RepID=UPI001A90CF71|nr:hypothetical protein [Methylobacterium indicum]